MTRTSTIYFGPPGTGKTTTLLNRLEEHLAIDRIESQRVAFLTFTRRARTEAIERAHTTLGIRARDLPHFRTIHSMAFKALKLSDGDVMGREALTEFGALMGVEFGNVSYTEQAAEGLMSQSFGDHVLAIDNLARLRGVAARVVWNDARSPYEWPVVDQFCRSYASFKHDKGMLDFTDVLHEYASKGEPLDAVLAFVDEAQDLSALQWRVVERALSNVETLYVAGDDDQAIYRWAGAEVEEFMRVEGERIVLNHSYRIPRAVHALSARVLSRITTRVQKAFTPRDADGLVARHASHTSIPLLPDDQWLWLVRNRYLLSPLRTYLMERGVVFTMHGQSSVLESERDAIYTWERLRAGRARSVVEVRALYAKLRGNTQVRHGHKLLPEVANDDTLLTIAQLRAEHGLMVDGDWFDVITAIPIDRRTYYRRLLREHGSLKLAPTVQLETIHGAKGTEAQKVALFVEQSRRTWEEAQRAPDEEHRVWYVGATRAREELHVIEAAGRYAYDFPRAQRAAVVMT
jgi:superfamily I DNA/RNA helicase